jgi:hypothetical protein
MTDPVHNPPRFHVTDRPIVRPLPSASAESLTGLRGAAASITRRALFGVDDGWFDAYWYGDRPEPGLSRLAEVASRLRHKLAALRPRHSAWRAQPSDAALLATRIRT